MASPGNQHCASCIGTLSFPIALLIIAVQSAVMFGLYKRWLVYAEPSLPRDAMHPRY